MSAPRESRQRHAVDVARRRGLWRVEIRVGINPDHTRPQPRRGAGDPGDGPDRDGVIPPEEDREQTLLDFGGGLVAALSTAAFSGGDLLPLSPRRDSLGDGHTCVPEVCNAVAKVPQACFDARVADGARSHIYAAPVLPQVHGNTEDPDLSATVFRQRRCLPNVAGPPPLRSV